MNNKNHINQCKKKHILHNSTHTQDKTTQKTRNQGELPQIDKEDQQKYVAIITW